jgi:hypothetical protein
VVGRHQRCLLLEAAKPDLDLEATLAYLVEWVQHLPRSARRAWGAAACRVFDIGIQAGLQPHETHWTIPPKLIRTLAKVGAEVVVTVYGARWRNRTARRRPSGQPRSRLRQPARETLKRCWPNLSTRPAKSDFLHPS